MRTLRLLTEVERAVPCARSRDQGNSSHCRGWLGVALATMLALGLFTEASAAQRLQTVVRRLSEGGATTNAVKTLRIAGTVVDADGKPAAGAVVECYQQGKGVWPDRGELEVKQHVTTEANGAFEFRPEPGTTILLT
jgi:hypothetical protein